MSDLDDAQALVDTWLQPLDDESAPCGPDVGYDNDFATDLAKAIAGKPESQFGPGEPPDWREVVSISSTLFERTRDLRVAVEWLRGSLHLHGYAALPIGLKLINGLIENFWDELHPKPDPDEDNDPWARVNALTLLRENQGALGDLRATHISEDRAVGILKVSDLEVALAAPGATLVVTSELTKEQAIKMLAAAVAKMPELRGICTESVVQVKALMAAVNDKLGSAAPDLRPLYAIVNGIAGALPAEAGDEEEEGEGEEGEGGDGEGGGGGRRGRGLSGTVNTRDEALKAIDLVIEFLERTEPTNPAPLFLRRARQLVGHNFLQLMKVLAPDALAEVARIVGVDPETVQDPEAEA